MVLIMTPGSSPTAIYVAFEAFPRPKGASSHMAAMIQGLARAFDPLWVLCCGFADMPAGQMDGPVFIYRYKMHHPNMLRRAMGFGKFVHHLLSGLPQEPELIVFRDPWGGWPAIRACPQSRLVFEVNGLPSWELPETHPAVGANTALITKIHDVELACLRAASTMMVVSEVTWKALVDLGVSPDRIVLVPNSADDHFFYPKSSRLTLDYLDEGRWFGYIGSLHPWQGTDLLLEAWAQVAEDWPEVRLLIVHNGRRDHLKHLRKRIGRLGLSQRVCVQSPVTAEELPGVLARLEFTVAPLLPTIRNMVQGCCPVKIVESMAAGTPVLASDLAVTRALIRSDVDGVLLPPGDVRSWALAINRILSDPGFRAQLATGAKGTATARFTRKTMFANLSFLVSGDTRPAISINNQA